VIPEKPPSPTLVIQEAREEARRLAHENRLEGKDLDELAELEDEEDEDFLEQYRYVGSISWSNRVIVDMKNVLQEYRKKRFAELSTITAASVYNQVYHLQKPDYSKEVTEASNKSYVFVLLTSSQGTNVESRLLIEIWRALAQRFGDVKFCQIRADLCIEGYPEKNTPTVLVYKSGDIRRQIVTLRELRGSHTTAEGMSNFSMSNTCLVHKSRGEQSKTRKVQPRDF